MITRITKDISAADSRLFRDWFVAEISSRYPLSTSVTADWLLSVGSAPKDPVGYFTLRKTIWKVEDLQGETIGFTVATEKRGGSVKFGPTLVAESQRGRGVGRSLRLGVEQHYREKGFRKAYSTTNLKNAPGISYLVAIGYSIEAHCRAHYQPAVDEVVLGKFLDSERSITPNQPSGAGSLLLKRLEPFYDGLDATFERNIFACSTLDAAMHDELAYTTKRKILFGDPERNFCVTTPKREGAVKLGPLLAIDTIGLRGLIADIVGFYRSRGARKLYCIAPFEESWILRELRLLGWGLEGALREPYRPLCDMAIISLFLRGE